MSHTHLHSRLLDLCPMDLYFMNSNRSTGRLMAVPDLFALPQVTE